MITEIGIVAGEIWHYLDEHGESSFNAMTPAIQRSTDIVFMSLGWLAREGHVVVRQHGRDYQVALRRGG